MNNFKTRKICRKVANIFCFIILVLCICMLIAVFRLYQVSNSSKVNPQFTDGELNIYMVDVGQGDSFILLQNDKAMLIDAGPLHRWNETNKALKKLGVQKIDYAIITHFHQDHAAGFYGVMLNYKIDHLFITDMSNFDVPYTNLFYYCFTSYINLVNKMSGDEMIELAKEDGKFKDFKFSDSQVKFLAPIDDYYENINDYSLVMKITYGKIDLLLTGDAEADVEKELLDSKQDLTADIYKAAHHGSVTSNTNEFLDAVSPKYVLISSDNGDHNFYGHPNKRFVEYLEKNNIDVYRTDESGTVRVSTDGNKIDIDSKKGDYKSGTELLMLLESRSKEN